jgi:hypothetical protein
MAYMLVRNKVRDFGVWKAVFDEQLAAVHDSGMTFVRLWQSIDDPGEVFFLFEISDMDKAKAFVADPASAAVGERAGALEGEIHYVQDID